MMLLQDVLQVCVLLVADLADVWVEPGLPGAVAHFARELGEVLGLELAAVDTLQPALAADLAQVGGHRVVVDLRPRDQENLGLHALHGTAHYRGPPTFTRPRHRFPGVTRERIAPVLTVSAGRQRPEPRVLRDWPDRRFVSVAVPHRAAAVIDQTRRLRRRPGPGTGPGHC